MAYIETSNPEGQTAGASRPSYVCIPEGGIFTGLGPGERLMFLNPQGRWGEHLPAARNNWKRQAPNAGPFPRPRRSVRATIPAPHPETRPH